LDTKLAKGAKSEFLTGKKPSTEIEEKKNPIDEFFLNIYLDKEVWGQKRSADLNDWVKNTLLLHSPGPSEYGITSKMQYIRVDVKYKS
jgi:hypothetical protein